MVPQRVQSEHVQVVLLDLLTELEQKRLTFFNRGRQCELVEDCIATLIAESWPVQ